MKRLALATVLSCLMLALSAAALAANTKADPADYPLAVHLSASSYAPGPSLLSEILTATIDGKHYELEGPASSAKIFTHGNGLLNPGDYHARLSMDQHKTSYESVQQFEILFPDGTTRRFAVIGQSE